MQIGQCSDSKGETVYNASYLADIIMVHLSWTVRLFSKLKADWKCKVSAFELEVKSQHLESQSNLDHCQLRSIGCLSRKSIINISPKHLSSPDTRIVHMSLQCLYLRINCCLTETYSYNIYPYYLKCSLVFEANVPLCLFSNHVMCSFCACCYLDQMVESIYNSTMCS